jgi:hypothetical protein
MAATKFYLSPERGVWSLASPQPEMDLILAGTVARPTKKIKGNDKCQNPNVVTSS